MPIPFLAQLAIGVGMLFLGYLLMPKPKPPKPPAAKDLEAPTAEAGRPIPVIFGTMTVKSANNLGWWDKERVTRQGGSGGGGGKKK